MVRWRKMEPVIVALELTWVERKAWKNVSAKTSIDGSGNESEGTNQRQKKHGRDGNWVALMASSLYSSTSCNMKEVRNSASEW